MSKEVAVSDGSYDALLHFDYWSEMGRICVRPYDITVVENGADVCVVH